MTATVWVLLAWLLVTVTAAVQYHRALTPPEEPTPDPCGPEAPRPGRW
ncbi:hypothetical protein ACI78V_05030 [Geodermatophilus sp. SYSU D00742]